MVEAAFYGDDFTGSTDALAQFTRAGLRSALLLELPSASELRTLAEQYDVIGVAGIARSLEPDEQEAEVRPVLTALRGLGARVVQYKVCSTADSSPERGSVGRALEIGREVFGSGVVPILVAQPELGRYTVFGNHFAAEGGVVYRLDRQPTMSTHPATPMHESDLCRHFSAQTSLRIRSLDVTRYDELPESFTNLADADAVVLDALSDDHLQPLGHTILANHQPFTIGSGGLSRALALALHPAPTETPVMRRTVSGAGGGGAVVVVSGSRAGRTGEQIRWVEGAGWEVLPVRVGVAERVAEVLGAGGSGGSGGRGGSGGSGAPGVVVHSNELEPGELAGLPGMLAVVIRRACESGRVRRFVVAGGDTSGQVLRELEITALELLQAPTALSAGIHLCRTTSPVPALDGLEVVLKPGQLGSPELFTDLAGW